MRWSQAFIPTLREAPAEAQAPSHQLLLRAGYVRQVAAGVYAYLYLAQRSLLKIGQIIREEMNRIGGQEFYLPALNPAELWQESGRWFSVDVMFKFKDRNQHDLCLGITHEEEMTNIARGELRSYKQLPQIWYQIQEKFRDEPRPKAGLLRLRQFLMKDSYSFDLDDAGLDVSYDKHVDAYRRIFERCGLRFLHVEAYSGMMGGKVSSEFTAPGEAGEDWVAHCACGYAANLEKAEAAPTPVADPPGDAPPEPFPTPGQKTIDDLVKFTGESPARMIKTLVYVPLYKAPQQPAITFGGKQLVEERRMVVVLLRGDHAVSDTKLAMVLGTDVFRPATPEEAFELHGAHIGSLGPVGLPAKSKGVRIIADLALKGRKNMITGANKDDQHLRNVTPGRDFEPEGYHDLRVVQEGDLCIQCGKPLALTKCIELGHVFKLGRRYSEAMHATVLDANGQEVPLVMGSYGIGLERILSAAAEQNHDDDGLFLPRPIAPFEVILTAANMDDDSVRAAAEKLYAEMQSNSLDVLYDDRLERPGVKFKDADLIGVPYRVTVGKRKLERGLVEIFQRSTKQIQDVKLEAVVTSLREGKLR
ncbi:MAG: proline--tRNA ligase [Acidobacteriia bacterium]|nr:proline--tRNA ligase [Terriglobia bacterium]